MILFYQFTPYILPTLATAILSAALAVYAWRHRTVPGACTFAALELCTTLLALFAAAGIAATTGAGKILWYKLEAHVTALAAPAVLYFAIDYTVPNKWLTRRNILLIAILPILAASIMATNDLHHLFWIRLWFDESVRIERGIWGNILSSGLFLFPLSAVLVTFRYFLQTSRPYRMQALLLLIAMALPPSAFSFQQMELNLVASFDPFVLAAGINGLLCAIAIYRFGMLSIIPIGRDMAMERMTSGMVTLDQDNRIVDLNPAARQLLALSQASIGQSARGALAHRPDLIRLIDQATNASAEITVRQANQAQFYQVLCSALVDPRGFNLGRLLLFHDVTEQKQAQANLVEQQRVMAMLEERERLACELHDTLVQSTASVRMQAETAAALLDRAETVAVHTALARIADAAQDMHLDLREYLFGAPSSLTQENFFDALRGYLAQFAQRWSLAVQLHVSPELEKQGLGANSQAQLTRIIQEALINVRKHALARNVEIYLERIAESQVQMVVQDDGRGFDPSALAAMETGGFGTRAMRGRAQAIGGTFEIQSAPNKGTRIIIQFPWEK